MAVQTFSEIRRGAVIEGFVGNEEEFVLDTIGQGAIGAVGGQSEVSRGKTIENAIAVIKSGGYEGVNKYFCRGVTERGAETGDVPELGE